MSRIWNSRVILRQKKITHTLINAQASTFQTRIVLRDQFQIELESKDIDNIRQKLVKDTLGIPQTQKIDDWIKGKLAKDPNSDIQVKTNGNNDLKCIYIQNSDMKKYYAMFSEILHIDSTFKVKIENYIVYIALIQDENLHGVPVAF